MTEEILQDIRPGEYAFSKELTLHDAVAARCTYDEEAAASENPASAYPNAFTVYGALVEGRALHIRGGAFSVCEGGGGCGCGHCWRGGNDGFPPRG